jgi:hypothetical protein
MRSETASQWFERPDGGKDMPKELRSRLPFPLPDDLCAAAQIFSSLQQERHKADYDPSLVLSRAAAETGFFRALSAFIAWQQVRRTEQARLFLGIMLFYGGARRGPPLSPTLDHLSGHAPWLRRRKVITMPSGSAIEAFAEKLRLAMGRANLSRAQLAQAAKVDKSVVGRWLNGVLAPSDHSLTSLTAVLARHLPQFDRVAWDAPAAEFARRLGVQPPTSATSSGHGPAVLPRTVQTTTPLISYAEARYAGLWMLVFPAAARHGGITFLPMRIAHDAGKGVLSIAYGLRPAVHQAGSAFELEGLLFGVMEPHNRMGGALAMLAVHGVSEEKPLLLDGFLTTKKANATTLFSVRVLAFRLGDLPDDAVLAAVIARSEACTLADAGNDLPEPVRAVFRARVTDPPGPNWMLLDQAESWTTGETRRSDPSRAPQMQALASVRALFADLVPARKA